MPKRKVYPRSVKLEALRLLDSGQSISATGRILGLQSSLVSYWRKNRESVASEADIAASFDVKMEALAHLWAGDRPVDIAQRLRTTAVKVYAWAREFESAPPYKISPWLDHEIESLNREIARLRKDLEKISEFTLDERKLRLQQLALEARFLRRALAEPDAALFKNEDDI